MLLMLIMLLPLMTCVVGGGENASSSSSLSARRDIDIAIQAANAPLEGSLLGLSGAVISYGNDGSNRSSIARIVSVTEAESDYAVHARNITPVPTTTTRAVLTGTCPSGQFNTDPYTCATCPWGFWCPPGGVEAVACALGTANPVAGASNASACVPCALGTYTVATGTPVCLACPPGNYCVGKEGVPTTCPIHTSSSAGASSLLDCACDADYACTYTRSVTLRLKLNTNLSVQALQSDAGIISTLNSAFLMALGLYGVPGVKATFKGFVNAAAAVATPPSSS
jgi:hypothetical protein